MRSWFQIFQIIAEMQPGDIDKLDKVEADLVRKIVDDIDKGLTMCLGSVEHAILNKALDKIAPTTH